MVRSWAGGSRWYAAGQGCPLHRLQMRRDWGLHGCSSTHIMVVMVVVLVLPTPAAAASLGPPWQLRRRRAARWLRQRRQRAAATTAGTIASRKRRAVDPRCPWCSPRSAGQRGPWQLASGCSVWARSLFALPGIQRTVLQQTPGHSWGRAQVHTILSFWPVNLRSNPRVKPAG